MAVRGFRGAEAPFIYKNAGRAIWGKETQIMTATFKGLPIYDAMLSGDGSGMLRISLVDEPAVESDFVYFSADRPVMQYSVQDEEKRIVRGVVMRANFPIFRRSDAMGEYYIVYKPATIRAMAEKYLAESRQNNVNLMHQAGSDVDGVNMVQYFIKDTAAGISPAGYEDITDGSLFAEFHVTNDDVWEAVKAGTYKGFSLEGIFDIVPEQKYQNQKSKMSKMNRIKEAIRRALVAFAEVTTDRGILGWDGDEDLKAGDAVHIVNQEGEREPAADGVYVTEDGKSIVVADGKVAEIRDPEAEVEVEEAFGEVSTDKGVLYHDGEEDLREGDAVFTRNDEGEAVPAEDGEYRTEDGKVITVVDGKVAAITDDRAEVAPEEEFRRICVKHEESYDEKFRKIADAIKAKGYEDFWVVEAGDDFAVAETWQNGADHKFLRFAISWDAEGNAIAGDPVEVKSMFVPVDYVSPFESEPELEALRKEVAQLRARPAAKPAHEEVKAQGEVRLTGNSGKDRLLKRFLK